MCWYCNENGYWGVAVLEEVLLLASSLLDSLPVGSVASSDMSLSMWVISLLELVPVPVSENISFWEGVVVMEGEILFEIFSFIVIVREYFTLVGCIILSSWEAVLAIKSLILWKLEFAISSQWKTASCFSIALSGSVWWGRCGTKFPMYVTIPIKLGGAISAIPCIFLGQGCMPSSALKKETLGCLSSNFLLFRTRPLSGPHSASLWVWHHGPHWKCYRLQCHHECWLLLAFLHDEVHLHLGDILWPQMESSWTGTLPCEC